MTQLRDAHTSELIAEGTSIEVVLIADQLGRDEVLFDGVGLAFDPDAALAEHEANVADLKAAAKAAAPDEKAELAQAVADAEAPLGQIEENARLARVALNQARARIA